MKGHRQTASAQVHVFNHRKTQKITVLLLWYLATAALFKKDWPGKELPENLKQFKLDSVYSYIKADFASSPFSQIVSGKDLPKVEKTFFFFYNFKTQNISDPDRSEQGGMEAIGVCSVQSAK